MLWQLARLEHQAYAYARAFCQLLFGLLCAYVFYECLYRGRASPYYLAFFLDFIILFFNAVGKVFCFAVSPDFFMPDFFIIFLPYAMCISLAFPSAPCGLASWPRPALGTRTKALAPSSCFAAGARRARRRARTCAAHTRRQT